MFHILPWVLLAACVVMLGVSFRDYVRSPRNESAAAAAQLFLALAITLNVSGMLLPRAYGLTRLVLVGLSVVGLVLSLRVERRARSATRPPE